MRLAAPSTYWSGTDPTAWATFVPIVMATAVRDPAVLESALRSIEESDWKELEDWLGRNPNPEFGLYRLWPGAKDTILKPTKARNVGLGIVIVVIAVAITVFLIVFGKGR
jgi:hypothetical protein